MVEHLRVVSQNGVCQLVGRVYLRCNCERAEGEDIWSERHVLILSAWWFMTRCGHDQGRRTLRSLH